MATRPRPARLETMTTAELEPFHTQHAALRDELEDIREAARELNSLTPADRRRRIDKALDFLQGPLDRHARAEEATFYPAVARALRHPAATEPMAFDHELVRGFAAELADARDDVPRAQELLFGLRALLEAHFLKEERFYLPVLASEQRADEIFAAMDAMERGVLDEELRSRKVGAHGFPLGGTAADKLRWAVPYAIQAPSSHNSQPWRFRITGDTLELRADRTRASPVVDPHDRELTISCGAALFQLRTALREAGELPVVEVLPSHDDPDLLAVVSLGSTRREPELAERQLFWSMRKRRTNRNRFRDRTVSDDALSRLEQAAAAEGAALVVVRDEESRNELAMLVAGADRTQAGDPRFRRELASWLHPSRARSADGMPVSDAGFGDIVSTLGPLVVRRFDWGRGRAARDEQLALGSPVLAVLSTPTDEPAEWIAAGQALGHLLLRATTDDLAASYLNQPVEVEELRRRLAGLTGGGAPQLVLRLGYGDVVAGTPRRAVEDVLD